MTSTLTSACPLCGLRHATEPLLGLQIREDHGPRPRRVAGRPGRWHPDVLAAAGR